MKFSQNKKYYGTKIYYIAKYITLQNILQIYYKNIYYIYWKWKKLFEKFRVFGQFWPLTTQVWAPNEQYQRVKEISNFLMWWTPQNDPSMIKNILMYKI